MKVIKAMKKPTSKEMVKVTKRELTQAKIDCKHISLSNHDEKWLEQFGREDHVGYIAGEIQRVLKPDMIFPNKIPDIWFINKDFFDKNYKEVKQDKGKR